MTPPYVGRFAPSPTGPLHFGSLVAALASWLDARAVGGRWLLRIEDVDTTRTVAGAAGEIARTLQGLGLDWDGEIMRQSLRTERYQQVLEQLRRARHTYACQCSRREVADSGAPGIEGAIYPGTCREQGLAFGANIPERFRTHADVIEFDDRVQGSVGHSVEKAIGDFILKRRDGLHAYQLAVVVDDADQAITDVVRGADLLWSTPRQVALQRALGFSTPRYLHVPVAANARGEKLSKQTLARPVVMDSASASIAAALQFLGQAPVDLAKPVRMLDHALAAWDPARIPRTPSIVATFGDEAGKTPSV